MDKSLGIKPFLLDLFFPKFCLGCTREGAYLCEDCRALLDICEFDYCLCEQRPQVLSPNQELGKCPRCKDRKLSGLYFALPYKNSQLTKKLIYQFKYPPYLKSLAKTLAGILMEHFVIAQKNTNEIWQNSVLIPVPLDKKKMRTRGYNQSEELAKELSFALKIPVALDVLQKIKTTESQMKLKKEEREKNLKGAFAIFNSAKISGKKIFLVDDVYTTGSTMEECAKTLKESGARRVWGIAVTREG